MRVPEMPFVAVGSCDVIKAPGYGLQHIAHEGHRSKAPTAR
jgi:hypothetical protein